MRLFRDNAPTPPPGGNANTVFGMVPSHRGRAGYLVRADGTGWTIDPGADTSAIQSLAITPGALVVVPPGRGKLLRALRKAGVQTRVGSERTLALTGDAFDIACELAREADSGVLWV